MDFGLVGLDHGSGFGSHISSSSSDPETKQKTLMYGSGFSNKQERSEGTSPLDDYWRSSKFAKSNGDESDFLASKAMAVQHQKNSSLLRSNSGFSFLDNEQPQQQMLSFSCPKSEPFLVDRCSQNATLPYFPNSVSAYNSRNITGLNSGSLANNGVNMHGEKGPFTPSQWMELEQQALIYKYITANVPIPSTLLIPIRKAFDSVGFSSFPAGLLRPNAMGWGSFHLGFSNNSDPEPGRCRRTDGKKWRCSRDAVADQKYCERHINRGRHRSRKPVEGQTGHVVAGANITATTTAAAASAAVSSSVSTMPCGGAASTSLAIANNNRQVQIQSLDISASNSSAAATTHINSMFVKDNAGERIQSTPGGLSLLPKESPLFLTRKNHSISYDESSRSEFGHVTSDSLLNPTSQKTQDSQHSLGQFMDAQWDRTQLSISIPDIPQGSLEFNSETNLSPLRLSREHNTPSTNNHHHKQANWIPISWETSLGGPLGEVLHHTTTTNNTNSADCKRSTPSMSSVLNLMTEGWDTSPPMGSSPTGVLQKTAFGSLSNSSAGSSPRAENNKALEGVSLCNNDVLGSAHLISSSSLPAL